MRFGSQEPIVGSGGGTKLPGGNRYSSPANVSRCPPSITVSLRGSILRFTNNQSRIRFRYAVARVRVTPSGEYVMTRPFQVAGELRSWIVKLSNRAKTLSIEIPPNESQAMPRKMLPSSAGKHLHRSLRSAVE